MAVELVSPRTVSDQKKLTTTLKLNNGIPVIYRQIPGSDILQIKVHFGLGEKDLGSDERILLRLLTATMPMAAKSFPKEKMNEEVTKYSLEVGCSGSTETSSCDIGTVNDFIVQSLAPFAAMIIEPALSDEDLSLQKERLLEATKQERDNPTAYINHVVNRVFYRHGHPYRLTQEEILAQLAKVDNQAVRRLHDRLRDSSIMTIIAVGSIETSKLIDELNKAFSGIKSRGGGVTKVSEPKFDKKDRLEFEERKLPTAYIRAKITAPGATSKDAVAANLMFDILSQKMFEEIRSKRSLSYTPYAGSLYMSIGIGVIDISTPKPKESLEALAEIIAKLKSEKIPAEDLEEYKRTYATRYFLTQESHQAMADGIARYFHYFRSVDPLYEMPIKLASVTGQDVADMATAYLKDFRVGVLTERQSFKDEWLKVLP